MKEEISDYEFSITLIITFFIIGIIIILLNMYRL